MNSTSRGALCFSPHIPSHIPYPIPLSHPISHHIPYHSPYHIPSNVLSHPMSYPIPCPITSHGIFIYNSISHYKRKWWRVDLNVEPLIFQFTTLSTDEWGKLCFSMKVWPSVLRLKQTDCLQEELLSDNSQLFYPRGGVNIIMLCEDTTMSR